MLAVFVLQDGSVDECIFKIWVMNLIILKHLCPCSVLVIFGNSKPRCEVRLATDPTRCASTPLLTSVSASGLRFDSSTQVDR